MADRPVLFLDVDGVLNHDIIFARHIEPPLDAEIVDRLNRLCELTGAHVVLSSAWRAGKTHDGLEQDLRDAGALKHAHPTDPRTKWLSTGRRGDEIDEWLSRHPEVTIYAIVDDEADMRPWQMPHFVQTNFQTGGMTERHAEALRVILIAEPPHG